MVAGNSSITVARAPIPQAQYDDPDVQVQQEFGDETESLDGLFS